MVLRLKGPRRRFAFQGVLTCSKKKKRKCFQHIPLLKHFVCDDVIKGAGETDSIRTLKVVPPSRWRSPQYRREQNQERWWVVEREAGGGGVRGGRGGGGVEGVVAAHCKWTGCVCAPAAGRLC